MISKEKRRFMRNHFHDKKFLRERLFIDPVNFFFHNCLQNTDNESESIKLIYE